MFFEKIFDNPLIRLIRNKEKAQISDSAQNPHVGKG